MADRIERISERTLIVGIDIAKHIHWAQFTDSRGLSLRKPLKIENSCFGFEKLTVEIATLAATKGLDNVFIGFEPSGHYWKTLAWYFKTSDTITLVGVNPYHVKQAKELDDNTQTKNDIKDALVIARLIRDGRYFDIYLPENQYADLRVLRKHRDQMATDRKRIMNNLTAILDEYFPEYENIGFNISAKSTYAILRSTPFPSDIVGLTAQELKEKWKASYLGSRLRIPRHLAELFITAAEKSVAVTAGLEATRLRINHLLNQMELLDLQIEECDQKMDELMSELDIADYLLSVPGVGSVTAASFIAETGDLSRFCDWKQIRKLAGLNLVEQSSGQHKGKTTISKRGRPDLRRIIYIIGDKGMLVSPEMLSFYHYLRHRPTNQLSHHQAVLAIGLKLMRIMFHVVKYREFYDPNKALGPERIAQLNNVA